MSSITVSASTMGPRGCHTAAGSERDEIWWIMQRGLSFSLTVWSQPGENCKRSTSQRSHHKSPSLPPRGPPGPWSASQEPPTHPPNPFQTVILEACRSAIHGTLGSCQHGGENRIGKNNFHTGSTLQSGLENPSLVCPLLFRQGELTCNHHVKKDRFTIMETVWPEPC